MSTGYTMDDRLRNWARWRLKNRSGGSYARSTMEERVDGDRQGWDAPLAINDDEADAVDIEAAMQRVEDEARRVIGVHYLDNSLQRVKLAKMGCSRSRYYEIVQAARLKVEAEVAQLIALRRERARAESQRLREVVRRAAA